jgi:hypothetical protein
MLKDVRQAATAVDEALHCQSFRCSCAALRAVIKEDFASEM